MESMCDRKEIVEPRKAAILPRGYAEILGQSHAALAVGSQRYDNLMKARIPTV
jgi:hypothetical protein